jgi:hypothetical protein
LELVSNREADEQVLTRKKKLDKRAFPLALARRLGFNVGYSWRKSWAFAAY